MHLVKPVLILSVIMTLCAGTWIYSKSHKQNSPDISMSSQSKFRSAPEFELSDAQGHLTRLKDLRGTFLVIHFWASWCAPCLQEIPEWIGLAESFQGRSVKWIAIHLDKSWEDAQKVLPSHKLPKDVLSLWDQEGKVADTYGTFQFPETYLVSPDLKIVFKWVGPQNWGGSEIRNLIQKLSESHPAPLPSNR